MVEALDLAVCHCAPALPNRLRHIVDFSHGRSRVGQGVVGASTTSNSCMQSTSTVALHC